MKFMVSAPAVTTFIQDMTASLPRQPPSSPHRMVSSCSTLSEYLRHASVRPSGEIGHPQ